MKKYLSSFTLVLLLTLLPLTSIKAQEPLNKEQKKIFMTQIQEKKKLLRQKTLDVKKMEVQFNDIADAMVKALEGLFTTETAPTEDFTNKVLLKQEHIFHTLMEISKIDSAVKLQKLEAKVNIDKGNYSQALLDYDSAISLLNKKEALLTSYSAMVKEFVELIKSLDYK